MYPIKSQENDVYKTGFIESLQMIKESFQNIYYCYKSLFWSEKMNETNLNVFKIFLDWFGTSKSTEKCTFQSMFVVLFVTICVFLLGYFIMDKFKMISYDNARKN